MQKNGIDIIGDVLLDFFRAKRIRESLDARHQLEISGWEKWWQIELAIYLASAESIAEWDMEKAFGSDCRMEPEQERMAVNIGFRLKHNTKGEWYFVELKQDDDYKKCIDKMCSDAGRIFAMRKHSFDGIRVCNSACAGAFLSVRNEVAVINYTTIALDSIDIHVDGIFLEPISRYHSLLIF